MRVLSLSRVLVLALATTAAVHVASETSGNAPVSAGDVLTVTSLSVPSSVIGVNAFATTVAPVTIDPLITTPSLAPTNEPSTSTDKPATTASPSSTTAAPSSGTTKPSTAPSAASSSTGDSSGVTCLFRYSMPTASNIADELASAAAAAAAAKKKNTQHNNNNGGGGSMAGSFDGSGASGSVSVGSKDKDTRPTTTSQPPTSGSQGGGGTTDDAGATTPSKTPAPTTKSPVATTKAPASLLTPAPTKTPKANGGTGAGSNDGNSGGRRQLAGMQATTTDETESNQTTPSPVATANTKKTPAPTPTPTKKTSTTVAPAAGIAPSAATGDSKDAATPTPTASAATGFDSNNNSTTTTTGSFANSTGSFRCDATFYSAWHKLGLKCGETELDIDAAVSQTQCLIYSGLSSSSVVSNMKMCMSVCRFPKCDAATSTWDYGASDGVTSPVYKHLNLLQLMRFAGASSAIADAKDEPFSNLTLAADNQCDFSGSDSDATAFSKCKCYNLLGGSSTATDDSTTSTTLAPSLTVPVNKGLGDSDHWADGQVKNSLAKVSIGAAVLGSSAATVSVVAGGAMAVASGVMGTTSAGVATGVSAGASIGITIAAIDICQFSIMINQMNLDARPRFLEDMGRRMAPAGAGFLPFWKVANTSENSTTTTTTSRRLADAVASTNQTQGMERYAQLIGVQVDKLFYLTVAGVGTLIAALFVAYALVMGVCYPFVGRDNFGAFSSKWMDKAVGVLMMILILSEYVIGVTATFQFCWCLDNNRIDASLVLSIATLLVLALGTILYGFVIIKRYEDELRDLGTKDHFDKRVHARYGPLYDEYNFEGRYFFAPKLLLALLCGMTTGMIWLEGLWQIGIMIALHIAFLFYLEVKQPYPTQFVQKTSSFVIIIKISALFLSFFLLSSATSFNNDLPVDLREGVGFAIVGLQVLVLICLMIRQVYIFYRTWKLKKEGGDGEEDDKTNNTVPVVTSNNRDGGIDDFFALGEPQRHANGHVHGGANAYNHGNNHGDGYAIGGSTKLRTLQPSRRTHTVVVHDTDDAPQRGYRNHEVAL